MSSADQRRTDPALDTRRLILYFTGLLVVYVIGSWVLRPTAANNYSQNWAVVAMAAPTAGALLARFAGPGVIVYGRLNLWVLAGLLPAVFGLIGYGMATVTGSVSVDNTLLTKTLLASVIMISGAMITALGEEIGWRGFLWPLVRRRLTFLPAWLVVTAIWWVYHLPFVVLGWYGSLGGLPAFTVAILGFGAFVGVITDRAHAIWPSVVAHGSWNALVATAFGEAFTSGNPTLLGEFGWIAAAAMVVLGALATIWHLRTGGGARMPYPARYDTDRTAHANG